MLGTEQNLPHLCSPSAPCLALLQSVRWAKPNAGCTEGRSLLWIYPLRFDLLLWRTITGFLSTGEISTPECLRPLPAWQRAPCSSGCCPLTFFVVFGLFFQRCCSHRCPETALQLFLVLPEVVLNHFGAPAKAARCSPPAGSLTTPSTPRPAHPLGSSLLPSLDTIRCFPHLPAEPSLPFQR